MESFHDDNFNPDSRSNRPQRRPDEHALGLKHLGERELITMLTAIQSRLGTRGELADDIERAAAIAHQLANIRTAANLSGDLQICVSKEEVRSKYGINSEDYRVVEALALRPTCEHCNRMLLPNSLDARICSFECTFCVTCVEGVIGNVCPNCGGGFVQRPVRPTRNWRNGNYLGSIPAMTTFTHKPVDLAFHANFSRVIQNVAPEKR